MVAYTGSGQGSRLESALRGPMSNMLPPDEVGVVIAWVQGGADRAKYDREIKPVLDKSFIETGPHYEANVRIKLDYGAVPMTVRILMFWVNDWHRESEWYTWTLQN